MDEAGNRLLEYDIRFIEAVEEGRASARRGELLEHDEVVESIGAHVRLLMQVVANRHFPKASLPYSVGAVLVRP